MPVLDYSVVVQAVAATEPMTVEDVKSNRRITWNEEDSELSKLLTRARIQVERDSRRSLISHTYDFKYDRFPDGDYLVFPRSPLTSVTHVKYYDENGTLQTWAAANYEVDAARDALHRAYNVDWPSIRSVQNAVQIRAVFGHGASDEDLELAKQAIVLLIGHWYENREALLVGSISKELELSYNSIIGSIQKRSYP